MNIFRKQFLTVLKIFGRLGPRTRARFTLMSKFPPSRVSFGMEAKKTTSPIQARTVGSSKSLVNELSN